MNTPNVRKNLILGLVTILGVHLSAQDVPGRSPIPAIGVITGTVVDSSTGEPIVYASVSLVRLRDQQLVTGGITDDKGIFHIKEIPLGMYAVHVEFIGYKKKIIPRVPLSPRGRGIEQNLGTIRLQLTALEMHELEVTAERPVYTQTIDRKVFNVENYTLSAGGTALDALRQVPGVDVDIDGNVSLRGSQNVNVLVDGKPSSLTGADRKAVLENIPAANIQDIEVITNPSAKYDPDGMAGILNIILKENRFAGLNGRFNLSTDADDRYNGSGQINFRNEKINLFTNLGYRHDSRFSIGDNYRETFFHGGNSILDQDMDGTRGGSNLFVKSGVELFPGSRNTFSLTASLNRGGRDYINSLNSLYIPFLSFNGSEYVRETDTDNSRLGMDVTLSFDRKLEQPKKKLSAFVNHSTHSNEDDSFYSTSALPGSEDVVDPEKQKTIRNRRNSTTNVQADYVHPLGKELKLEAGYKGILRLIDDDFLSQSYDFGGLIWNSDDSLSNHFVFAENIQAAYAQISGVRERFQYQLGARAEYASTVSELRTTGETFKNPYSSIFPSGSISFGSPRIFQIQTSYSRRINRPSLRRLNPFPHFSDNRNIQMGNPFLKPEYIDVIELNFSRFEQGRTLTAGFYYRRTLDKMDRIKIVREDGVGITTSENLNESQTYGLEMVLSGRIAPGVRATLSGNVYRDEVNASNLLEDYDRTATGFFGRGFVIWNVRPGTEFMLSGFYRGPRDIPIGRIDDMFLISGSIKQKLMGDRFSVSLRYNDILNTMGFRFETYGDNYAQQSERKWESRILMLTLEYNFGKLEDRSRFGRQEREQEESEYSIE